MCTHRLHVFGHIVFIELVYGFSLTFRQQTLPFVRLRADLGMIKGAQAVLHHARLTVWQQRWAVITDNSWQWPLDLKLQLTKPYWFRTGLKNVHAASNSCTLFMFFFNFNSWLFRRWYPGGGISAAQSRKSWVAQRTIHGGSLGGPCNLWVVRIRCGKDWN